MPLASLFSGASAQSVGHLGRSGGQRLFVYTGSLQSWVVPNNLTRVRVDMAGGAGGGASNTVRTGGGRGGHRVQCTLTVTPGATLQIAVGAAGFGSVAYYPGTGLPGDPNGDFPGGWPGGGYAGAPNWAFVGGYQTGGSGGGYSAIFTSTTMSQANVVLLAGGGGGRGMNNQNPAFDGGHATTTAAGSAGTGSGGIAGQSGSALKGGEGATAYAVYNSLQGFGGGGGGGGYFGGGGGYSGGSDARYSGAGGDGSSFVSGSAANVTQTLNANSGNGYITLTW